MTPTHIEMDWSELGMVTLYPLIAVPIGDLHFAAESVPASSPDDPARTFENPHDQFCYDAMRVVPSLHPDECAELLRGIPVDVGFDPFIPEGREKIHARMCLVYRSIKDTGRLINPLIVRGGGPDYYMVVGWQRLCALKMLGHEGNVPCRVLDVGDGSSPIRVQLVHPYVDVPGLYGPRSKT